MEQPQIQPVANVQPINIKIPRTHEDLIENGTVTLRQDELGKFLNNQNIDSEKLSSIKWLDTAIKQRINNTIAPTDYHKEKIHYYYHVLKKEAGQKPAYQTIIDKIKTAYHFDNAANVAVGNPKQEAIDAINILNNANDPLTKELTALKNAIGHDNQALTSADLEKDINTAFEEASKRNPPENIPMQGPQETEASKTLKAVAVAVSELADKEHRQKILDIARNLELLGMLPPRKKDGSIDTDAMGKIETGQLLQHSFKITSDGKTLSLPFVSSAPAARAVVAKGVQDYRWDNIEITGSTELRLAAAEEAWNRGINAEIKGNLFAGLNANDKAANTLFKLRGALKLNNKIHDTDSDRQVFEALCKPAVFNADYPELHLALNDPKQNKNCRQIFLRFTAANRQHLFAALNNNTDYNYFDKFVEALTPEQCAQLPTAEIIKKLDALLPLPGPAPLNAIPAYQATSAARKIFNAKSSDDLIKLYQAISDPNKTYKQHAVYHALSDKKKSELYNHHSRILQTNPEITINTPKDTAATFKQEVDTWKNEHQPGERLIISNPTTNSWKIYTIKNGQKDLEEKDVEIKQPPRYKSKVQYTEIQIKKFLDSGELFEYTLSAAERYSMLAATNLPNAHNPFPQDRLAKQKGLIEKTSEPNELATMFEQETNPQLLHAIVERIYTINAGEVLTAERVGRKKNNLLPETQRYISEKTQDTELLKLFFANEIDTDQLDSIVWRLYNPDKKNILDPNLLNIKNNLHPDTLSFILENTDNVDLLVPAFQNAKNPDLLAAFAHRIYALDGARLPAELINGTLEANFPTDNAVISVIQKINNAAFLRAVFNKRTGPDLLDKIIQRLDALNPLTDNSLVDMFQEQTDSSRLHAIVKRLYNASNKQDILKPDQITEKLDKLSTETFNLIINHTSDILFLTTMFENQNDPSRLETIVKRLYGLKGNDALTSDLIASRLDKLNPDTLIFIINHANNVQNLIIMFKKIDDPLQLNTLVTRLAILGAIDQLAANTINDKLTKLSPEAINLIVANKKYNAQGYAELADQLVNLPNFSNINLTLLCQKLWLGDGNALNINEHLSPITINKIMASNLPIDPALLNLIIEKGLTPDQKKNLSIAAINNIKQHLSGAAISAILMHKTVKDPNDLAAGELSTADLNNLIHTLTPEQCNELEPSMLSIKLDYLDKQTISMFSSASIGKIIEATNDIASADKLNNLILKLSPAQCTQLSLDSLINKLNYFSNDALIHILKNKSGEEFENYCHAIKKEDAEIVDEDETSTKLFAIISKLDNKENQLRIICHKPTKEADAILSPAERIQLFAILKANLEISIHKVEKLSPLLAKLAPDQVVNLLSLTKEAGIQHANYVIKFLSPDQLKELDHQFILENLITHPDINNSPEKNSNGNSAAAGQLSFELKLKTGISIAKILKNKKIDEKSAQIYLALSPEMQRLVFAELESGKQAQLANHLRQDPEIGVNMVRGLAEKFQSTQHKDTMPSWINQSRKMSQTSLTAFCELAAPIMEEFRLTEQSFKNHWPAAINTPSSQTKNTPEQDMVKALNMQAKSNFTMEMKL